MAGTILVLALLEDYAGVGSKEILGVNALSSAGTSRQSQFSSRIRRRSEAMATKLGPSFHTEPPTSYTFSNDTGEKENHAPFSYRVTRRNQWNMAKKFQKMTIY